VLVGARTHLRDTVVLDGTYIGEDLEIVRKIIAGRRVTDPDTGVSVDVLEQFLVSELHGSPVDRLRKRAVGILVSLPVLALQLPLFLLLRAGVEHERARYYGDADGRELVTERYFKSGRIGLLQRLFFRLSLDGVPLLLKVLSGQLVFSGNRLAPADAEGLATLEELPSYAPGAFSYSDLIGSEPEQWLIDDLYYASHRSVWLDLKIFFGTLVNRLLSPGEPR
jgi:lipopolysaccharide/colanic/teichoic acid biosynthesis glycosyltransferase